mgnify:CR=1 FL=1
MTAKRGGLGKGLDSLIKENKTAKHTAPVKKEVVNAGPIMMKINDVEPNRDQENILRKMLSWNLPIQSNSLESYNL